MSLKLYAVALYASKSDVFRRTVFRDLFIDARYVVGSTEEAAKEEANAFLRRECPFGLGWRNHFVSMREVPVEILKKVQSS